MGRTVGLACLVAAGWLATAGTASASPARCVAVVGDPAVAEQERDGLARRGVRQGAVEDCPGLRVEVAPHDDGIVVEAIDADGRRSRKTVRDAGTAVVLSEAWAEAGVVADAPVEPVPAAQRLRRAPSSLELALGGGMSASVAEVAPIGTVAMCWRSGRQCLGVRATVARGSETAMATEELRLPLFHRLELSTAVGAGLMAVPTSLMIGTPIKRGFGFMSGLGLHVAVSSQMWLELAFVGHYTPGVIGDYVQIAFEEHAEPDRFHEHVLQGAAGIRVRLP